MRWLWTLPLLLTCSAYRILLVFPMPSTSHTNLGDAFVRHLLKAGHQVTYITPVLIKNAHENLRQIDLSANYNQLETDTFMDLTNLLNKDVPQLTPKKLLELILLVSNRTVFYENVQALIHDPREDYDLVIADWIISDLYCGFAVVFNCPLIWTSSMDPHSIALNFIGEDVNPAYVTSFMSTVIPPFSFIQRMEELWKYVEIMYHRWSLSLQEAPLYDAAFSSAAAARGRPLPPYDEARFNASLMFGNSHVSIGSAISLPQKYVPIAGIHVEDPVKNLPEDLQSVMDNAKNGVIFFSMGSILSSKTMPKELKQGLLATFGRLKQTVIWKLEEATENLPDNVHTVNFAPQQSILAHPNLVIFVTHGGLLSNIEAVHFGVPVIGIPVFADQFLNVGRAVQKGYAKRLDLGHDLPDKLEAAINDVLQNSIYRERAKELSMIYHDRLAPPARALVHGVELVVRTRGAPHLHNPAALLSWYQKMYLDLAAVVLAVLSLLLFLLRCLLTWKIVEKKTKVN